MALTLAEEYGAEILGVTLSREQLTVARERVVQQGLDQRVRFEQKDYRDIDDSFDRIVSVGMFEHVGLSDYTIFSDTGARLLCDDGVALVHTIATSTIPQAYNPWVEKYIFPGGHIPSLSQIAPAVERSGLILTDLEVLRVHYADTLKAWRKRLPRTARPRWRFMTSGSAACGSSTWRALKLGFAKDRWSSFSFS